MATISSGISLVVPNAFSKATDTSRFSTVSLPWKKSTYRMRVIRPVAAAPDSLSEKVAESIKNAEEACSGDAAAGECAAAWDEVEELSAAVSHLKDKAKDSDPLETYCKDNPETDECRTYDN